MREHQILEQIKKIDTLDVTKSSTYTEIAVWYHRYDGVYD